MSNTLRTLRASYAFRSRFPWQFDKLISLLTNTSATFVYADAFIAAVAVWDANAYGRCSRSRSRRYSDTKLTRPNICINMSIHIFCLIAASFLQTLAWPAGRAGRSFGGAGQLGLGQFILRHFVQFSICISAAIVEQQANNQQRADNERGATPVSCLLTALFVNC